MRLTSKIFKSSLVLLCFLSPNIALAEPTGNELVWELVQNYARCIQNQSLLSAVKTKGDVSRAAEACSKERKNLDEIARGRSFANEIDDRMMKNKE